VNCQQDEHLRHFAKDEIKNPIRFVDKLDLVSRWFEVVVESVDVGEEDTQTGNEDPDVVQRRV
jgi:hypothetical protein